LELVRRLQQNHIKLPEQTKEDYGKHTVPDHFVAGALPFTRLTIIISFEFSFPNGIQSGLYV